MSPKMMVAALSLAALLSAVACGDDEASTTTSSSGSAGNGGSGGGLTPPPESCVQPGDVGNVNGVGTPCTPGGGECKPFPLAPVCLADFGQDEWFCTRIGCDATTDCGMGAGCLLESAGSACVPCVCDDAGVGCGGGTGGSGGAATAPAARAAAAATEGVGVVRRSLHSKPFPVGGLE